MANSINDNYSINELLVNKNYTNPEHLYIHIPFCKKRCPYCSFYSTIYDNNDNTKDLFISALLKEIKLKDILGKFTELIKRFFQKGMILCLYPESFYLITFVKLVILN